MEEAGISAAARPHQVTPEQDLFLQSLSPGSAAGSSAVARLHA